MSKGFLDTEEQSRITEEMGRPRGAGTHRHVVYHCVHHVVCHALQGV